MYAMSWSTKSSWVLEQVGTQSTFGNTHCSFFFCWAFWSLQRIMQENWHMCCLKNNSSLLRCIVSVSSYHICKWWKTPKGVKWISNSSLFRPCRRCVNSDVAGGYSASMLDAMRRTLDVSKILSIQDPEYNTLTFEEVFRLATLGGSQGWRTIWKHYTFCLFWCYFNLLVYLFIFIS